MGRLSFLIPNSVQLPMQTCVCLILTGALLSGCKMDRTTSLSGASSLTINQALAPLPTSANPSPTPSISPSTTPSPTASPPTSLSANDPLFSQQVDLFQNSTAHIHVKEAWALQTDCSGVPVAVLDSGVDMAHPDLAANIYTNPHEIAGNGHDDDSNGYVDDVHGWNFVASNNNPTDDHYHGTHVSGTIGAIGNNGIGIAGICWKAQIVPLKFLDQTGSGLNSDAIKAIYYAVDLGVKVINASFGGGGYDAAFKAAIDYAAAHDVLFIAAAGNDGADNDATPFYPAGYASTNLISVASVDAIDAISSFSNFGATSVLIAAPGENIYSTTPTVQNAGMTADHIAASYDRLNGTSMAAPHIAGVAALYKAFDPSQTAASIKAQILSRADVISGLNGKVVGSRRLNARATLH